jgi:hypothetical protein
MNKIATTLAGAALTLGFIATGGAVQAAPAAGAAPQASGAICAKEYQENADYIRINNCTNMYMMTKVYHANGAVSALRVGPYNHQRLIDDGKVRIVFNYYYM